MSISGKTVIITGASSGIGEATARALAAKGAKLMLAARRTDRLADLSASLPTESHFLATDVTQPEQVQALVDTTLKHFGSIDGLVNNAGLGYFDQMADAKLEDWHRMVDVNIKGVLSCIHAALPHLIESRGHIINLASVAAHNVWPNSVVYAGTKHFVKVISKGLRLELRDKVRITNISPGAVATEFADQTTNADLKAQFSQALANGLRPEDIADAITQSLDADPRMVISEWIIRPST